MNYNSATKPSAIFVGSIPSDTTSKELRAYFSTFGKIQSLKYKKKPGKLSNNVAILKIESKTTFDLIFRSQPLILKGTELKIREKLNGFKLAKAEADIANRRVYVKNIPLDMSDNELQSAFQRFGDVELCYICKDKRKLGAATDYAFVTFVDQLSADRAKDFGNLDVGMDLKVTLVIRGFKAKSKMLKQDSAKIGDNKGGLPLNVAESLILNVRVAHKKKGFNRRKSTMLIPNLDFSGLKERKNFSRKQHKAVSFNHYRDNIRFNW